MFSLMANCFQWMKTRREPPKQVTLALIGLDNAGKTTTILGIQGESQDDVAPTVGFVSTNFKFEKFDVTVFDLGGGKKIRPIWKSYYAEIHGVVFVLDASDESRLRECQDVLQEVLKQERIAGKRILILANKQDKEGALDEIDICDQLSLEDMVTDSKCPCRVETCSAVKGIGKKMDKSVNVGLQWLLQGILKDWPVLTARVAREQADQKEADAIERKAKTERIRKRKEERERKEAEERKRLGIEEPQEDEDEDVVMGDPFKAVDKKTLQKQAEKKKNTKTGGKKGDIENVEPEKLNNNQSASSRDMAAEENNDTNSQVSQSASGERNAEAEKRLRSEETAIGDDGNKRGVHARAETEIQAAGSDNADIVVPQEKKKKKKKKLKKKNKLAPLPLDGGPDELAPPLSVPSWASTMNQRPLTRPIHQPTLDPLPERISPRLGPIESKSSLNGDKLIGIPSTRTQPNVDQDDDVIT
ncbi:uncharacterized protein [Asterias amurensis]|uniref:uncharacterized protein n=1 Tax=Asterias amurensis TaxID=7602 RepID=UPI003AB565C7